MRNDNYAEYGHMTNGSGRGMAILSALALGVAVGMLLAPSDGRRLRGQIRDGAQRLGKRTSEGYNAAARKVSDIVDRGKSAVTTGREAFEEARSGMPPADM